MFHMAPIYFRASSRVDYAQRNRARVLAASAAPLPAVHTVDYSAVRLRALEWMPRVASGEVSAEYAANETAGFVSFGDASEFQTFATLALDILKGSATAAPIAFAAHGVAL